MKRIFLPTVTVLLASFFTAAAQNPSTASPTGEFGQTAAELTPHAGIYGELKKWHKITLAFEGPSSGEQAAPNPFLDYRLEVTFTHESGKTRRVPGYFAVDGAAGETGATEGNIWRVHFLPDATGKWTWKAMFLRGENAAVIDDSDDLTPIAFHDESGEFEIASGDKSGRDFRARGALRYVGGRYLQFSESGEWFLKGGADSPENFLAYFEFDGTAAPERNPQSQRSGEAAVSPLHHYQPHVRDWREGDPTWRGDRGKGIIGALNYLAGKGMNSVYFLTMNVGGDGKDVWPWTSPEERFRFDCSKLDQWEIVFSHMDRLGLAMHVITQETENDQLLDGGALGLQRKLYYRELIARFAHHPAVIWNLGEENTNTLEQRKAFCEYFQKTDPYDHPIVVHTFPDHYDEVYTPLLEFPNFEGPSLQMGDPKKTHSETIKWIDRSAAAGRKWFVCLDEIGPANTGVKPDADDFEHDEVRHYPLWGNLMAGGAGVEWYFGYEFAYNDLNCEDWRSRDHLWDLTRYALDFFHEHLPFAEMNHADELTTADDDYCLAKPGEIYAIYLPHGGATELDLQDYRKRFEIFWYDPRAGGELQRGTIQSIQGPGKQSIGSPPSDEDNDWVVLIKE